MSLRPVGEQALLAEFDTGSLRPGTAPDPALGLALDLALWLRAQQAPVVEIVPAACTVLLDGVRDRAALAALIGQWRPGSNPVRGDRVTIEVEYDGPDLDLVAEYWGCSVAEVVARHTGTEFVAAFTGFVPGFAYLSGLPQTWQVPRRSEPRTRVVPGSVALGDRWTGIYPSASPAGWQILGTTDVVLWDPTADPPALLAPGTRVRFRERR